MSRNTVYTKDLVYNKKFPTVMLVESLALLGGYRVHLTFNDGTEREVDLEPVLVGPVLERIRNDPEYFRQVFVDPTSKTLTWPNGVDLDPDSLRYGDEEAPWWTEYKKEIKREQAGKSSKSKAPRNQAKDKKTSKVQLTKKQPDKSRVARNGQTKTSRPKSSKSTSSKERAAKS